MKQTRLSVPLRRPEDVKPHLGKESHWQDGRSAKRLAQGWWDADGIAPSVAALPGTAPQFRSAELIDGFLERKTDLLDNCGAPSQTDLLALLGLPGGTAILGVEAKVDESFGPFVASWLADGSLRKRKRLRLLCERLGLDSELAGSELAGSLRYQLLHRIAATLIEAARFRAPLAVFAVQSFCPDATGFRDFAKFASATGFGEVEPGMLAGPQAFGQVELWIGWSADH